MVAMKKHYMATRSLRGNWSKSCVAERHFGEIFNIFSSMLLRKMIPNAFVRLKSKALVPRAPLVVLGEQLISLHPVNGENFSESDVSFVGQNQFLL